MRKDVNKCRFNHDGINCQCRRDDECIVKLHGKDCTLYQTLEMYLQSRAKAFKRFKQLSDFKQLKYSDIYYHGGYPWDFYF